MEGTIVNFRSSVTRQKGNHLIIIVEGITTREKAKTLVGKKVIWKTPAGKEITGEIKIEHGNSGAVRAIMEKGMPGQAVGTKIQIE